MLRHGSTEQNNLKPKKYGNSAILQTLWQCKPETKTEHRLTFKKWSGNAHRLQSYLQSQG